MLDPKQNESQIATWAPEGSPITVEYSLELMAQIRDHVIVGFHRLAKRGIECGGILYGRRNGSSLQIEEIREIRCEYKLGPSFVLSDVDREKLILQLEKPEAELSQLVPVGIYISHTKDDIQVTERDVVVYDHFFPDPWQVLLVLRPARLGSVRAGFFVREPHGGLKNGGSYEEFELDPSDSPAEAAALIATARRPIEPERVPDPLHFLRGSGGGGGSFGVGREGTAAAPAFSRDFVLEPPHQQQQQQPSAYADSGRALVYGESARQQGNQMARAGMPDPRYASTPREKHWSWLVVWVLGVCLIAAGTYWLLSLRSPAPLLLRVAEQNGDLRIEWDRASSSISRAAGAILELREGSRTRELRLSPEQLANGSYLFPLTDEDVVVRLSVNGILVPRVEESVNFLAEARAGVAGRTASEAKLQRDRLATENRTLREDLRRERTAAARLEQRLQALEERMASPTPARRQRGNNRTAPAVPQ